MSDSGMPSPEELARVSKLFSLLDDAGRLRLLEAAERRHASAGEVVCREGEKGDQFFVLLAGRVAVVADDFGSERRIAELGPGAFFGEMAMVADQPRSATVVVEQDADLLVFGRAAVQQVLHDYPLVREALGKVGVRRTEELIGKLVEG
jgi:CRP-like cAMP-binding protein